MVQVSIFNDITSPELCECLRKESSEAEGYVDALRLSITGYADGNVRDLQDGSVILRRGKVRVFLFRDNCYSGYPIKAWQQSLVDVRTNMVEGSYIASFMVNRTIQLTAFTFISA